MQNVILVIVLFVAAMALIVAEIITPMFGALAVLSLGCVGWAVYLCFLISDLAGVLVLAGAMIFMPIYIILTVKLLPKTPLGRRLTLIRNASPPGEGTPEVSRLSELIGRQAAVQTALRPTGMILLDQQRLPARSETGIIEPGAIVEILRIEGSQLVVREIGQENPREAIS